MPKITGRKAATARIRNLSGPKTIREVGRALYAGGNLIEIEAELLITAGSVSGKGHVASLPGQPPNRDTGILDNNIETTIVDPLRVQVSSNAPYAAALEYGTSRMAARPYMKPAVARKRKEVVALVRGAVKIITKRGAAGGG